MTKEAERQRLYKAVHALCLQAGTDTAETIDWLCGPHGGMAKLFAAYFSPKPPGPSKSKIKTAILAGEPVAGARIVRNDRLTIK